MKILTSWDDASSIDTRIAGLLDKYALPGIFYIPSEWRQYNQLEGREPLSIDSAREISEEFEIGSHGVYHRLLTRIPLEQAKFEIEQSKKDLEEMFDCDVVSFCYPRGYANPTIQKMVENAGYDNARSTLVGYVNQSENPYFEQTTVHVGYDRKEYGGMKWLDYALKMLETAQNESESIFHLWGHSWEIDKYGGWKELETLFKRLAQ